jgi:hypothetical protein
MKTNRHRDTEKRLVKKLRDEIAANVREAKAD